jgi:alkyldihydroxyacetonephosphate synthase
MRLYDAAEARQVLTDPAHDGAALFLSHDGLVPLVEAEHAESRRIVEAHGGTSLGALPVETWYSRRFDYSAVESLLAEEGGYAETIEVAHLWSGLPALYDALIAALDPLADETFGHFSHVYTHGASVYVIVRGRAPSNEEAAACLTEIWRVAMQTTTELGGELSHHHGAGLARQDFIHENLGNQHELIRRLKSALDPDAVLNPGHLGL